MSGNIIPLSPPPATAVAPHAPATALQSWGAPPAPPAKKTPQVQRLAAVLGRFKWLILGCTILGTAGGIVATRFVHPTWQATARVWINSEAPLTGGRGDASPGRSAELVSANAWIPLFQSGRVSDEVVRELGLYVQPEDRADSALVRGFQIDDLFQPGSYELSLKGTQMQLATAAGQVVDRAALGDSIGRPQGFRWRPDPTLLRDAGSFRFTVMQPRAVSGQLSQRLTPRLQENFLTLTLSGGDPHEVTQTLQRWLERFVGVARELKTEKLRAVANTQMENLVRAEEDLKQADMALQQFKVGTITMPSEGTAVAAGVSETQPTVMTSFFQMRERERQIEEVIRTLERILAEQRTTGVISEENLYTLAALTQGTANVQITRTISELTDAQSSRRALLQVYTDSAQNVRDITQHIAHLQSTVIPGQARSLLAEFRQQRTDLRRQLASAENELRDIPLRSTEEERLERDRSVRAAMYNTLKLSQQAAQLAAESAVPDVSVLDWPVVPDSPTSNTVPQILAIGVLGGLALGILLALLIDRMDQRYRYPEQAKDDLGLDILGAVPRLRSVNRGREDPDESTQVLEAFRLLRMNVRHAIDAAEPVALTVSSAAASDGKSLVASNLAVSFAEAGHRVLLIDGDIRRGALHAAFDVEARPGLSEVLTGAASRHDALRQTSQRNLTLLPCGKRNRQAPELLASAAMVELLAQLRPTFDVIIVDSPPISAGIDAPALGMATGTMLIVLRAGQTNMRLAQAKLAEVDRLPIFLVGAVLNGITPKGIYQYYAYEYGYAAEDEEEEELPEERVQPAPARALAERTGDEEPVERV
jgi:capsular exopolysaccharide synthesis family protein